MKDRQRFSFRRLGLAAAALAAIGLAGARTAGAVACSTAPNVTSVSPDFGPQTGGLPQVKVLGTGFCSSGLKVWFGANKVSNANVSFVSSTEVDVTPPASTIVGSVTVRVQQQTSSKTKQSRLLNGYTYTCVGCTVTPVSLQFEGVDTAAQTTEPNGVLEPGESTVAIKPTVQNTSGSTEDSVTGAITSFTGPQNAASDIVYHMDDSAADYGSISSGATADCGSDCYAATITIGGSGNRPTVNTPSDIDWDAQMEETPTTTVASVTAAQTPYTWRVHVGGTFTDEPKSDTFYDYVERLVHNHVTFGTNAFAGLFSPGQHSPRNQMATFIARAFAAGDANVPASGTISPAENPLVNGSYNCDSGPSLFADVGLGDANFCRYIHYITKLNVTSGCNASVPDYCPLTNVSRAVMAVFISRALVPGLGDPGVPNSNTGTGPYASRSYDCANGPSPFLDVPLDSPAGTNPSCKNIGYIWTLGIIDGDCGSCNNTANFSPNDLVTRGQMSKFIDNAFNLVIGPAQ
ncbi:MAG TPA: IPT/TIG domain-containing protein [Thermoanaerobaculia bacterium]|nr:IPT/TIG domain-containing protein [Thermoanaerobaculia bacterium]